LEAEPMEIELSPALAQAVAHRPELEALRITERLRREDVVAARAGYKPSVQILGVYGSRSAQFGDDLSREISGWHAGAQVNWDIFDGALTKGKVQQARALHERTR